MRLTNQPAAPAPASGGGFQAVAPPPWLQVGTPEAMNPPTPGAGSPGAVSRAPLPPPIQMPPAPAPAPAPGGAPNPFAAGISDITGEERPQAITPGASATQPLQDQAQAAASRALENPSAYDDSIFKADVARGRESLDADLANRGLDYSTLAPQLFSDRVLSPLLSERARTISADRQRALEGATSVIGQRTGLEAQGRGELRGERGYTDTLREQARQNELQRRALQESSFQTTLQQALASGDPSRALAALQSAAYGMGQPAAAYGEQAQQTGAGLGELAQQFIQQFYGNRGTTP